VRTGGRLGNSSVPDAGPAVPVGPALLEEERSMNDPTTTSRPAPARRTDRSGWYWLLLVPLVAVLYPPLYNRTDPTLFGIPFFYWYQLAIIPVSMLCTLTVHLAARGPADRRVRTQDTGPEADR
jgi:hypothetical protein